MLNGSGIDFPKACYSVKLGKSGGTVPGVTDTPVSTADEVHNVGPVQDCPVSTDKLQISDSPESKSNLESKMN